VSLLNKFRDDKDNLSKEYRDVLDNLSDDDKVEKIHDILVLTFPGAHLAGIAGRRYYTLEAIVEYYNLQNNEKLKDLIIKIFGKNPKYSYMCSLLIRKRLIELEEVIKKDKFYSEAYRKAFFNGCI
jgi:hypothetical protein